MECSYYNADSGHVAPKFWFRIASNSLKEAFKCVKRVREAFYMSLLPCSPISVHKVEKIVLPSFRTRSEIIDKIIKNNQLNMLIELFRCQTSLEKWY